MNPEPLTSPREIRPLFSGRASRALASSPAFGGWAPICFSPKAKSVLAESHSILRNQSIPVTGLESPAEGVRYSARLSGAVTEYDQ